MAGIYIHIPFCKQACHYCNFYFTVSLRNKAQFIQSVLKEIKLTAGYLEGEKIETIYFGGGTPSLLEKEELIKIVEQIAACHNLDLKEFTLEANPDDLNTEKIKALAELKKWGFNRFSIGVQSFFDEDLKYMNRVHKASEALDAVKRVQDAGFENITIDLIYGTPTMNDERWLQNLATAFGLNIPHISSYALTVEPKTALEKKIKRGAAKPVDEEQAAQQFKILMHEMRAHGYEQYEISNFAKPGKFAVHNSNYWSGKKYLGLGPSAHSFNGAARRWNVSNILNYVEGINKGQLIFEEEILTEAQKVNEKIMTSLRTQWGLRIAECGVQNAELIRHRLSKVEAAHFNLSNDILTLTDAGKLFADGIAAALFVE